MRARKTRGALRLGACVGSWCVLALSSVCGEPQAVGTDCGLAALDTGAATRGTTAGLRYRVLERGFDVEPVYGDWKFGLQLVRWGWVGWEREVATGASEPEPCSDGKEVSVRRDEGLVEWYRERPTGIEHGYTVRVPPRPHGDVLRFFVRVRGGWKALTEENGESVLFAKDGRQVLGYRGLKAFDADGRRLAARMRALDDTVAIEVDARGARFPVIVDPTVTITYVKASNPDHYDQFGYALAISGDTMVVGAPFEASSATGVGGNGNDDSAPFAGAAYVFVRDPVTGAWSQQAYLKASNTDPDDRFGWTVAIWGDTIVVGAPGEDSGAMGVNGYQADNSAPSAGAAYVFVRDPQSGVWSQQAYLKASNTDLGDRFGASVSISGDTIVVGAPNESSAAAGVGGNENDNTSPGTGAAYVFVRDPSTGLWSQQVYLKASNPSVDDHFGVAVSISGDRLVVGAVGEDSASTGVGGQQADDSAPEAGAAYVFARDPATGSWIQEAYLKATNTDAGDRFGHAVAISGDTVVVGAWGEDSSAVGVNSFQTDNSSEEAGAAYEYRRDALTGAWAPHAYFKASNTDAGDQFGRAVALFENTLVVGAPLEDGAGVGIDSDASDDSAMRAGAAYVFVRDPANGLWNPSHYLKASNTDLGDQFGSSLAVSGPRIAVGAPRESSGSAGVGGDQSDDTLFDAGAVYVFGPPPPVVPFGAGCAGLALGWQNEPRIGSSNFTLTLLGAASTKPADLFAGASDASWLGIPLPLYLGPFGAPGCALLTGLQVIFPTLTDASGQASVPLSIPNDPAIVGCQVFFQWRVHDGTQNPLGMVFSDGLAVTFVP